MIQFAIDSPAKGPGYILVATTEVDGRMPAICTKPLTDHRAIALQARQLVDAAAALLEPLVETPELERAFEHLHDALDVLPTTT
jgi:hypothetical protein